MIIFLYGNNLKVNTQRSSLLRQLGCVFVNLNQCVLGVKVCGSLTPHLNTPFLLGLLLKIDCKLGIESYNGIEMQMEFVCFVMMHQKLMTIYFLDVVTRAEYGENWQEVLRVMVSRQNSLRLLKLYMSLDIQPQKASSSVILSKCWLIVYGESVMKGGMESALRMREFQLRWQTRWFG